MKNKILFLLLLCSSLTTMAQDNNTLVLWHADGTQTRIELFTQPQITFSGDVVDIVSPVASFQFPADQVLKFTYEGESTGIVKNPAEARRYVQEGDRLLFSQGVSADRVLLYAADGKQLPLSLTQTSRGLVLPLSDIPTGVYLLSVNGQTSKFVKR